MLLRTAALRAPVRRQMPVLAQTIGYRSLFTVPQPPGNIVGGVNDAVKLPTPSPSHGSYHWSFERLVSIGLVPLVTVPFAVGAPAPLLDASLGALLIAHSHIGLGACITDYIPKRKYGKLHDISFWALYAGTAVCLYGLYEFETNDIGLSETIRKTWNA